MLACIDLHYADEAARAACLVFSEWGSAEAVAEHVVDLPVGEPYVPGEFFRRELPGALRVLTEVAVPLDLVIVDGYVWLSGEEQDAERRRGLGAHLWESLEKRVAVVGVAKNPFHGAEFAAHVLRGESKQPLYITSAGIARDEAAAQVRAMHGGFRLPTLLKRVDRLARGDAP